MIDRTWYVYRNLGRMDDGSTLVSNMTYMTDNSFLPHNYIYTLNVILCNKRKFTGTVANVSGVEMFSLARLYGLAISVENDMC